MSEGSNTFTFTEFTIFNFVMGINESNTMNGVAKNIFFILFEIVFYKNLFKDYLDEDEIDELLFGAMKSRTAWKPEDGLYDEVF